MCTRRGSPLRRHGLVPALLLCGFLAATLAAAPTARAESGKGDYVGAWSAAALAGYAIPTTDTYDNSFTWRVAAGYSPMPAIGFDLEYGGFSVGVSAHEANGIPSYTIASGTLDVRYVGVTARWRPPLPESYATLLLLGGAGYYFVDYTMAEGPRQVFTTGGVAGLPDQKVEDAFGFHVGAGVDYVLTERLSLVAEGRYLILHPGAKGTAAPGSRIAGSIDLNTWLFTGGLRVLF